MPHSARSLIGALACVAALAGCGKEGPPRYHLDGKITWAGQPIPAGLIYFDPDIAAGVDGPQGFAVIENGRFDTRQKGLGHGGGKYVCRVFAADGIEGPEAPLGKPLFPEYSWPVELPAEEVQRDFDVPREAGSVQ